MRVARQTNSAQAKIVLVLASSSALLLTWKYFLARAKQRARKTVDRVKDLMKDDTPLIDYDNPAVRKRILETAVKRASKWMALREQATPMGDQVGGLAHNKRPMLTLAADYILKPLLTDRRGVRETAFYEAIEFARQNGNSTSQSVVNAYAAVFLGGQEDRKTNIIARTWEAIDTVSLALAMMLGYDFVKDQQVELRAAWRAIKREIEALQKLAKFIPRYYGIVGQTTVSADVAYGLTEDAYLMCQSVSAIFSQACIIDLKLGVKTYEPDASEKKAAQERIKYEQQIEFGFRIVGMRVYDPTHEDADNKGFRNFDKAYGCSLKTREDVKRGLRTFFSGGDPNAVFAELEAIGNSDDVLKSTSSRVRMKSMSDVHHNLRSLRRWFEDNKSLHFTASSLLIVYEGNPFKGNGDVTALKLIDFGHVRRNFEGDPGCTLGLKTLTHMLGEILEEEKELFEQ